MHSYLKSVTSVLGLIIISQAAYATDTSPTKYHTPNPICAQNNSPYRDLDFLVGHWEFFMVDSGKIADQIYSKKEQGCLILEDWSTLNGETGTGMNFVDPATGKWRQVWVSARFHIDYSGGLNEKGDFVLEGRMYPNNGQASSAIKGIYSKQTDGSVTKEFLQYNEKTKEWQRFFMGVARKKI